MTDSVPTIKINLTVEEVNYILATLGQRPFTEVANIFTKVKSQAESQVDSTKNSQ